MVFEQNRELKCGEMSKESEIQKMADRVTSPENQSVFMTDDV